MYAPLLSMGQRPSQLALLVGVTIATYSVVDKVGVSLVNPLLYLYLIFFVSALLLSPYMLTVKRRSLRREWQSRKWSIVAVAVMFAVSYLLVLVTLTTTKVGYVASVREVSVVFAALLGAYCYASLLVE